MANIIIKNGDVVLKGRILKGVSIEISDSKIASVGRGRQLNGEPIIIDADGCFVSPGFIDCHIHGECEKIFLNEAKHGTTAFVAAESCAPLNYIYKRAEGIKKFIGTRPFGPNVLGLRLEGPYISKAMAGAQDTACIRTPDSEELSEILCKLKMGHVPILKIMTIAPELKGARPLLSILRKDGIIASIGHSAANYEKAIEGIDAGITHATHTFNAMSPIDRREPGVTGAVLSDDRVTAEVILDLIHVHKALFELLVKMKKKDNIIIVTDSLTALNCSGENGKKSSPKAIFLPASMTKKISGISMTGGAYRFKDGRLAGSSLTMIGALKNAVKNCNIDLLDAVRFMTLNPARLLGVANKKGSIGTGKDADVVIFDKEFDVKMTMIRGKIAYRKRGF